jgi:hypothetical protein
MGKKISEIIVEVLDRADVKRCTGIVGDTLNLSAENLEGSSILPGNSRQPIRQPVLVAIAVRFHGIVSHHLSVVHHRSGCMADGTGSAASDYPAARVPPRLRLLAEDLRDRFRYGRGLRNRTGLRVRRELERTVTPFGADSGTVAVL